MFDPLCGEPLERVVAAAAPEARIVQLGQSAGPAATLPSAAIRSKHLELFGYSNFAVPAEVLCEQYRRLVGHAAAGEIRLDVKRVGLDELEADWERPGKLVVVPLRATRGGAIFEEDSITELATPPTTAREALARISHCIGGQVRSYLRSSRVTASPPGTRRTRMTPFSVAVPALPPAR